MGIDEKRLKKLFPRLSDELETEKSGIRIASVRSDLETVEKEVKEKKNVDPLSGYVPDVVAFIRRCETEEQAIEIINYLEQRKEVAEDYAEVLKKQLHDRGLRSFGEKKDNGYYFRKYYKNQE